jgi:hypothetical protein
MSDHDAIERFCQFYVDVMVHVYSIAVVPFALATVQVVRLAERWRASQ